MQRERATPVSIGASSFGFPSSFVIPSFVITPRHSSFLFFQLRRLIEQQPVHSELLDGGDKALKVHGLDDVAVHPEVIALDHVSLLFGRREHDGWNHPRPW